MTKKQYDKARIKKSKESKMYHKQVNALLDDAAEKFLEGKKSVILKLPDTSEEFFNELKKTAFDEWSFDVKKLLFGRVKIFSGIIYTYP